jgi:hypothetical protein
MSIGRDVVQLRLHVGSQKRPHEALTVIMRESMVNNEERRVIIKEYWSSMKKVCLSMKKDGSSLKNIRFID